MTLARRISLAYSPDTDDAFMVQAMREGAINLRGYQFDFTIGDIQELNDAARRGVYDITAISVGAFPSICSDYLLMPVGASIGDKYGPALIVHLDSNLTEADQLRGRRIAVPGLSTSAFFAATALIGGFEPVPMPFLSIPEAVRSGQVDAGLLIHERQLDCESEGVRKLADLGLLWDAAHHLPLPLGANAIRRDLGTQAISDLIAVYRESIEYGLATRAATLQKALAQAVTTDLDTALGERYISMYVNQRSLELAPDVRRAIDLLYCEAKRFGLCDLTLETDEIYA